VAGLALNKMQIEFLWRADVVCKNTFATGINKYRCRARSQLGMRLDGLNIDALCFEVRTHNTHSSSENRMHSDDVAAAYGFKGALVPGVTVFSHMTQPLVAKYGAEWLARGSAEVEFAKPAYEGELLSINTVSAAGADSYALTCVNEQGVELARMSAWLPAASAKPDARGDIPPAPPLAERPTVTWDLMAINQPFPALAWSPTREENREWCADVRDALPLYRDGDAPLLHPGLILRQANFVLRKRFVIPAWIHAASRITFFAPLRAGSSYEVRAIPEEKWNHKGHEFVRLFVAVRSADHSGRTVAEIIHTAIFRPRVREAGAQ
jgi:hypothetical protein